ncbi:WYL domain-containing protein [Rathayibacter sp. VKM Ac-2762]|uniref:helix-turn-helix transcriptional regulator n=1 Tax=unclassified Rathayibacter TaxID=2609250 RepID=UPI000CE79F60|nr:MULTISPECIES: WYL domain-containing protein [unclassified Rathayibacter]QHF20260.1 WYL domain-containing protein [Rathayibacter sp. VKM Ac-2762]PPG11210.1 WYL domain-containing protein [Rathayibacter sp. AY2B1]PPG62184.1 WYL domain-containing protein [Rathayibacter sp. AY1C7]PPG64136.1 WYL domain-containing protein [Rathayibacter sp. AY2B7]PPG73292.1 WYL domain-containing protein [Rathayibacter sp. AY1F4]
MPSDAPSSSRVPAEERLFNLVLALVAAENGLTKADVLSTVQGYRQRVGRGDRTSLERQFERDKDDLRELGIPIETVDAPGDPGNTQTVRYRIAKRSYDLPADLTFDPEELALLRLAGAVWREGTLSAESRRALIKLRSIGVESVDPVIGISPSIRVRESSFEPLNAALDRGQVVRFPYLKPGGEEPRVRTVQPRALVNHQGRWHLHGWDEGAEGTRTFLLSRIVGPVASTGRTAPPAEGDHAATALAQLDEILQRNSALLRVAPDSDAALRLGGRAEAEGEGQGLLRLHYTDPDVLADELAGHGPEVRVLEPEELRRRVLDRLRRTLDDHGGDPRG